MKEFSYHQWSAANVAKHFEADCARGLSEVKANFRLQKYGLNSLNRVKDTSVAVLLFRQFTNPFVLILLAAAIISYFVDGMLQMMILILIVIINIALSFFQEYKAERALNDLKRSLQFYSKVLREGEVRNISSDKVVLGDIVFVEAGDKIPADLRLIEHNSLQIDESTLTGESMPVEKKESVLPIDIPLADRKNMLYAGTITVSGFGKGIVTAIGDQTEFGKIAQMVNREEEKPLLEKQVRYLAKILTFVALLISVVLFSLGYFRQTGTWELLTFTIAMLISVVPESLPTAITLTLATGVSRMAKKKAIVRKLSVIETLGATNIIATDKTGTLTKNQLKVELVSAPFRGGHFEQFSKGPEIAGILDKSLKCLSVSDLTTHGFIADSVDAAIVDKAVSLKIQVKSSKRIFEVPFNSENKYMAAVIEEAGRKYLYTKGSPEKIIGFCGLSMHDRQAAAEEANILSEQGFKVIALAEKKLGKNAGSNLSNMKLCGFIALADEPQSGVSKAIGQAITAGIRPIIITGDHPETARYIAEKIGMTIASDEIITAQELEKMTVSKLKKNLEKVKIFARISPADKLTIVDTLQKAGYSVAVTGDGVNDAPALKEAEVGIAMGKKGSDISKDSADIVLSDDKFGTIIRAIEYGRSIYDNFRNIVTLLIAGNLNEVLLVFVAYIFGLPVPFVAVQILWINLVIEDLAALSLSFEKPNPNILLEKPRSKAVNALKKPIIYALTLSVISFILGLFVYLFGLNFSINKARTMVFFFSVFIELLYALSIRSKKRIWESPKAFFQNRYLVVSVIIALLMQFSLFIAPVSDIFGIVPLTLKEIALLFSFSAFGFIVAEITRSAYDKKELSSIDKQKN